jgi:RNA polymerase primary sigma factor
MHIVESRSTRLPAAMTSHALLSAEQERAAFQAIADARVAAWVAVLSHRSLAPRCLPVSAPSIPEHAVWDSAREAAVMRPTRPNVTAMQAVAPGLASALAADDKDDTSLRAAAQVVGRLAAKASTPAAWVRQVGDAMRALAAAIDHVERHNVRLVVSIATSNRHCAAGILTLHDLVGHGAEGLRTAVLRFDLAAGCRFSTYATWWIRHHVRRAAQNLGRTIRLPTHLLERASKALAAADRNEVSAAEAEEMRLVLRMGLPVSMEAPVNEGMFGDGDNRTIADSVADDAAVDPVDAIDERERRETLDRLLATLPERERFVVECRFGLHSGDGEPDILRDVGSALGLTRERVRQIENAALARLRAAARVDARRPVEFDRLEVDEVAAMSSVRTFAARREAIVGTQVTLAL